MSTCIVLYLLFLVIIFIYLVLFVCQIWLNYSCSKKKNYYILDTGYWQIPNILQKQYNVQNRIFSHWYWRISYEQTNEFRAPSLKYSDTRNCLDEINLGTTKNIKTIGVWVGAIVHSSKLVHLWFCTWHFMR